jgi:hypothetical protein
MGIRLVFILLFAMVSALIALDLGQANRFTLEIAVAFLVLVLVQGWLLQRAFNLSTGEAPAYMPACSACAMAMFCGAMLTLLLTVALMSVLGDKAADLPVGTLLINSFIASTVIYWVLATPRFCSWRRLGGPPRPALGPIIGVGMSACQQVLYLGVWLALAPASTA